jgi:hypothetical protein
MRGFRSAEATVADPGHSPMPSAALGIPMRAVDRAAAVAPQTTTGRQAAGRPGCKHRQAVWRCAEARGTELERLATSQDGGLVL